MHFFIDFKLEYILLNKLKLKNYKCTNNFLQLFFWQCILAKVKKKQKGAIGFASLLNVCFFFLARKGRQNNRLQIIKRSWRSFHRFCIRSTFFLTAAAKRFIESMVNLKNCGWQVDEPLGWHYFSFANTPGTF